MDYIFEVKAIDADGTVTTDTIVDVMAADLAAATEKAEHAIWTMLGGERCGIQRNNIKATYVNSI